MICWAARLTACAHGQVAAGAVAWPHPEKVAPGLPKAVNRKHGGHAGEDAYFCLPGR